MPSRPASQPASASTIPGLPAASEQMEEPDAGSFQWPMVSRCGGSIEVGFDRETKLILPDPYTIAISMGPHFDAASAIA